jgi:pilus assembly protein Flp/PilA
MRRITKPISAFPAALLSAWRQRKMLTLLLRARAGVTAIEYGLIAALISIAAVVAMSSIGTSLSSTFNTIAGKLTGN